MKAVAKLNNCPTSPRKMRLVADSIRGIDAFKALNQLKFTEREAAKRLEKLVFSAIKNWESKNDQRPEDADLIIKEIFVDGGRTLKRFRPAPFGRGYKIRKRSNHVTVVIDSKHAAANAVATVEESTENAEN
jgi:large subunit ribosomal protein L22